MKVMCLSHSAVVEAYRARFRALAGLSEIDELVVLCPKWWMENLREVKAPVRDFGHPKLRYVTVSPMTWGFRRQPYLNVLHLYRGLGGIIERERPDIIDIIEEPYSLVTAQVIFTVKRLGIPCETIFFSAQNIRKSYPPPFSLTERYVFSKASRAHPLTGEVLDVLKSKGYRGPASIIPLGVDLDLYTPENRSRARRRFGIEKTTVAYFGRLVEEKGVKDFIRAVDMAVGDFNVLLAGDGPLKRYVQRWACMSARKVIVTGAMTHEAAASSLSAIDVLVLPSRTTEGWKEQFGRVIIEAQAAGVAVIGSSSGEIPRLIGESGLVFEERNTARLAGMIEKLVSSARLLDEYKRRGYKRAVSEYSWKAVAEKTMKSYRALSQDGQ